LNTKFVVGAVFLQFLGAGLRAEQVGPSPVAERFEQMELELVAPPSSQTFIPPPDPRVDPMPPLQLELVDPASSAPYIPNVEEMIDYGPRPNLYRATEWRFEIGFIPTTSHLSHGNFGLWTDDPTLAIRVRFRDEDESGFGLRGQSWSTGQKLRTSFDSFETSASTHYFDVYKRLMFEDGELLLGGGLAVAYLKFDRERYTGVGTSVAAEGFYPLLRFETSDVGVVGHARFALVTSWDDEVFHDNTVMIDELGWGLELRRRFGVHQQNYWFIDVVREVHHWTSMSDPFAADEVFQGLAINFGAAW
jgi:hypothetical protein